MENRSNYVIVGSIALAMVVGIFLMVLWLARFSGGDSKVYDIYFKQSITGLALGSPVQFNGVTVGKITQIRLLPQRPEFVRVRINIDGEVPVLEGTTAGVEGVGFTGVSQIQLDGAVQGAKPITEPGPDGAPVIPPRTGGLNDLLATAPEVLSNVSLLTKRLNDVLKDENREALAGILKNTDVATAALAKGAPDLATALAEARTTMTAATATLQRIEALAGSGQALVDSDLRPLAADLRRTVTNANATLAKVDALAGSAQPGVEMLANQTIPETTQLIRELRETTSRLGAIAAKLDEDPAGALIGGRRLPEYQPPKGDAK
ncbi:MlaD family protein [Sandarakinorhabdus limnophila]|jgi:phospholipid/cholesterol/gamma-HCH transport system substrate-binding protein|uniref:MlaD family protein n=2 Tax=Sandarakinorhabdus TaxID=362865 RepID=UPI0026ECDDE8|nr:MlaD family protein [Sandarakinorhabdus limnophila]